MPSESPDQALPRIRIGLLESEPIRSEGFAALAQEGSAYTFVATDVGGLARDRTIRMALIDLHDQVLTLQAVTAIRAARPELRQIVMGSSIDDEVVLSVLAAGAKAYLHQASAFVQVEQAIEVVGGGSIWAPRHVLSLLIDRLLQGAKCLKSSSGVFLTPREEEVLHLLLAGKSNKEIAEHLGITCRTIKAHIARLLRKTGAENRVALSLMAVAQSLLPPIADSERAEE